MQKQNAMMSNSKNKYWQKAFQDLDLHSSYSLMLTARKGIKAKTFYDLAVAIDMSEKNLAALINLSPRTISNYASSKKSLDPIYSEHLLKLILLFEKGEELFGSMDEFNYWLKKPLWNSNEKPMDWLSTSTGVDLVMSEMNQLAEGYPV